MRSAGRSSAGRGDWGQDRLYLFARPPESVQERIDGDPLLAPARAGRPPVARDRRHVTLLALTILDVPRDMMIAASRHVVSMAMPEAFDLHLDRLAVSAERALLTARRPSPGVRHAQRALLDGFRRIGLALPMAIAPKAHVTLGYGHAGGFGTWAIDPLAWRVEEIALVLSHHGETRHETLARWTLPGGAALAA